MSREPRSKVVISTVENLKNITIKDREVKGTMSLIYSGDDFFLCWCPLDGTTTEKITAVFDYLRAPEKENWEPGEAFCFPCAKLSSLVFMDNPQRVEIRRDITKSCVLVVEDGDLIPMLDFIEQVLINAIALPSMTERYALEFYKNCHRGTIKFIPAHIQIEAQPFSTFEEAWNSVTEFFEKLIIHLDASGAIPQDPEYPINSAACALHSRVVEKVTSFANSLPNHEDITKENFKNVFDEKGKIKDPEEFKLRLFHGKTDPCLLPQVIPFAVGLYPLDSTEEERTRINEQNKKAFEDIEEQLSLTMKCQIDSNEKYASCFRIIDHDVLRTDRQTKAFKQNDSIGLEILTKLLRMYVLYNPPISYLQGMNDLLVPFIMTFIPDWSEEGVPLDADGNEFDYKSVMPTIFWCFDSMLVNINHLEMLKDITEHCGVIALEIQEIMGKASPIAAVWMKMNKLQGLLWCYSDFVLIFKRSFEEIWPIWLKFNTAPNPQKYLVHFIASLLIFAFNDFSLLNDVSISVMMDAFPRILSKLDPQLVGKAALWVAKEFSNPEEELKMKQLNEEHQKSIKEQTDSLDYFSLVFK